MSTNEIVVERLSEEHAGELLTLRRAAFVSEAQQYGDPFIPPLTQTLGELRADLALSDVVTLGAWLGHRLVGSVRVEVEAEKVTLGRLAVAPDVQGQGIGTRMMYGLVPYMPETVKELWVFTGKDSKQNIAFYEKNGYQHQHDKVAGDLTFAYLKRILGDGEVKQVDAL